MNKNWVFNFVCLVSVCGMTGTNALSAADGADVAARVQGGSWLWNRFTNATAAVRGFVQREAPRQVARAAIGGVFKSGYALGTQGLQHVKSFAMNQYSNAGQYGQAVKQGAANLAQGANQWAHQAYQHTGVCAEVAQEKATSFVQGAREYAMDIAQDAHAYAEGARMEIAPLVEQGLEHGRAVGVQSLHWLLAADAAEDHRSAMMALRVGGLALGAAAIGYLACKALKACKSGKSEATTSGIPTKKQAYNMDKELAQAIAQEALSSYFKKRSQRS